MTVETATTEPQAHAAGSPHRIRRRVQSWQRDSFGPASEKPFRRRLVDAVRLAFATGDGISTGGQSRTPTHSTLTADRLKAAAVSSGCAR